MRKLIIASLIFFASTSLAEAQQFPIGQLFATWPAPADLVQTLTPGTRNVATMALHIGPVNAGDVLIITAQEEFTNLKPSHMTQITTGLYINTSVGATSWPLTFGTITSLGDADNTSSVTIPQSVNYVVQNTMADAYIYTLTSAFSQATDPLNTPIVDVGGQELINGHPQGVGQISVIRIPAILIAASGMLAKHHATWAPFKYK